MTPNSVFLNILLFKNTPNLSFQVILTPKTSNARYALFFMKNNPNNVFSPSRMGRQP